MPEKEILLISLTCIGDAVLTTPVMRALKDAYPDSRLTVVVGPAPEELIRCCSPADEVLVFLRKTRHRGMRGMWLWSRELPRKRWDLVVDLRNGFLSWLVFGARRRVLGQKAAMKNRNTEKHSVLRHLDVLESAGIPTPRDPKLELMVPGDVLEQVRERLSRLVPPGIKPLAVYPGAGSEYKIYPTRNMGWVAGKAYEELRLFPVYVGSAADRKLCEETRMAAGGFGAILAGELGLVELAALLKLCHLVVTNDSGPMHIACAVGTKVVAIFGPTSWKRYGPFGSCHRVVNVERPCNPCKAPTCGGPSCINDAPREQILAALQDLASEIH